MTLTKSEKNYLDIISRHIADRKITTVQLADQLNIDKNTVCRAIKWGNSNGVISALSGQELPKHIRQVQKELKWLDTQRQKITEQAEKEDDRGRGDGSGLSASSHGQLGGF